MALRIPQCFIVTQSRDALIVCHTIWKDFQVLSVMSLRVALWNILISNAGLII